MSLSSKKVVELREIAKSRGIRGYSKLRKGELIKLLDDKQSKSPKPKSKKHSQSKDAKDAKDAKYAVSIIFRIPTRYDNRIVYIMKDKNRVLCKSEIHDWLVGKIQGVVDKISEEFEDELDKDYDGFLNLHFPYNREKSIGAMSVVIFDIKHSEFLDRKRVDEIANI